MSADDDGCALATHESGGNENPGVGPIEVRACRADNFTHILARDSKISFGYFAGRSVHDLTSKANRVRAVTRALELSNQPGSLLGVHGWTAAESSSTSCDQPSSTESISFHSVAT
jgi:hypothetical protein